MTIADGGYNQTVLTSISVTIRWSFLGLFLGCLIFTTIFGNFLVILAVLIYKNLRNVTNFFIVSLACADLLMGCVVMPFAAYGEISEGFWPFGSIWCDLWHAFDVLSSTASILNLCMIAIERFWATENPITYSSKMNKKRCLIMIGIVWFVSSVISFPAIAWWQIMQANQSINMTNNSSDSCIFPEDKVYLTLSSIFSFYIPLIIMIVVYIRIYRTATRVIKSLTAGTKVVYKNNQSGEVLRLGVHRGGMANHRSNVSSDNSILTHRSDVIKEQSFLCFRCKIKLNNKGVESEGLKVSLDRRYSPIHLISSSDPSTFSSPSFQSIDGKTCLNNPSSYKHMSRRRRYRKTISISLGKKFAKFVTEQKAAKTLGIVMGIFIICWLPFFICNILSGMCPNAFGTNKALIMTIVTWLGYLNSGINPMIYAHSMRDFRRAFIGILCCFWRTVQWRSQNFEMSRTAISPSSSFRGRSRYIGRHN